jgi:Ca2+/Na+ antiporter
MKTNLIQASKFLVPALLAFVALGTASASGATFGDAAQGVFDQMKDFANVATAASFLAGIVVGITALFKFKAYSENPQQTKIAVPIVLTLVAACLIGLPAFLTMGQNTILEGESGSMNEGVYDNIGN